MKIGMNLFLWCDRLRPEFFSLLAELKAAGFDGVEIPAGDYSAAEVKEIRAVLSAEGLACTVATLLTAEHNPISADAAIRAAALEKITADIALSHALGAESLVGPMHSGHKVFHGRGPNQQEFQYCQEFLHSVGSQAAQADVVLAVEPLNRFECYFLNTAEQAARLMDAVDLPGVGVLYDTHHANIEENCVYNAICGLDSRIKQIHISESHRGTPGTGTVDWESSFRALTNMNYQGWVVIEAFASDVPGFPDTVNIWRDCFASKTEVYQQGMALIRAGQEIQL
jgi:D-psicose/D-tagatose/L-ribulose 3-epimerase